MGDHLRRPRDAPDGFRPNTLLNVNLHADARIITGGADRIARLRATSQSTVVKPPQQLGEETRLRDALGAIIKDQSTNEWLQRPNMQFDGSTPLQLIERGETDRIWRMISQLREGNSG